MAYRIVVGIDQLGAVCRGRIGGLIRENAAHAARHDEISSSESFSHTLLDMADIATPRLKPQSAITSGKFEPVTHRQFLNDRNRSVNLIRAGFTQYDLEMMQKWDMVAPSFTDGR